MATGRAPQFINRADPAPGSGARFNLLAPFRAVVTAVHDFAVILLGGVPRGYGAVTPEGECWSESGVTDEAWKRVMAAPGELVVVAVHGTGDADPRDEWDGRSEHWWQVGTDFQKSLVRDLGRGDPVWVPFHWEGSNSEEKRDDGARMLATVCGALSANGRNYCLVGHSHGGNVINYMFTRYSSEIEQPDHCVAVVTYGTPYFRTAMKSTRITNVLTRLMVFPVLLLTLASMAFFAYSHLRSALGAFISERTVASKIAIADRQVSATLVVEIVVISGLLLGLYILFPFFLMAARASYNCFAFDIRRAKLRRMSESSWLAIAFKRDEVLGLLPKVGLKGVDFSTVQQVSNGLRRVALVCGRIILIVGIIVTTVYSTWSNARAFVDAFRNEPAGSFDFFRMLVAAAAQTSMNLFWLFLMAFFIAFLFGKFIHPVVSRMTAPLVKSGVNGAVKRVLRETAYGDDHEYKLVAVQHHAHLLKSRVEIVDKDLAGNIDPSTINTVSEEFYDSVIGFKRAQQFCSEPDVLMADLMDAIYHNAYFADADVLRLTVSHINACHR